MGSSNLEVGSSNFEKFGVAGFIDSWSGLFKFWSGLSGADDEGGHEQEKLEVQEEVAELRDGNILIPLEIEPDKDVDDVAITLEELVWGVGTGE